MVYEAVATIRLMLGLDADNWSDADIALAQTQADAIIDAYPNNAGTAIKKMIETELVFKLIARSNFLHNYGRSGLDFSSMGVDPSRPIVLSNEQKLMLDGKQIFSTPTS